MHSSRIVHYFVLVVITGLLTLPNLGAHSLWDMDEGVNAECSREMLESGTWIVPTFNWELRTAKPVMTYWLQRLSYLAFGVSEWSARFPSVILALGSVLMTYELGRRMFDSRTGLLAGVALITAIQFNMLSHAATPDAPLIFFTTLTFLLFWSGHIHNGRIWILTTAAATGFAVLSKGPIGLGMPGLAVVLYFLWNREWKRIFDLRLFVGLFIFAVVAVPWYALVTSETRGEYTAGFFGEHNVNRFMKPMENHRGPFYYYVLALIVLFTPWSCFLGATIWYAVRDARRLQPAAVELSPAQRATRILLCWVGVYLVFFSMAATKLPNYIAPLYPAIALLTARFLMGWREGTIVPPKWVIAAGLGGIALTGVLFGLGFVIASGVIPIEAKGMRLFPGLEWWSWIGLFPLVGAGVMLGFIRKQQRGAAIVTLAVSAMALIGVMAAGPILVVDRYKSAKELVRQSGVRQTDREIRLGTYQYFQDCQSLVFYAERRIELFYSPEQVRVFLQTPLPVYLFVSERVWNETFANKPDTPKHRIVARKYDFYRNTDIIVVTNQTETSAHSP